MYYDSECIQVTGGGNIVIPETAKFHRTGFANSKYIIAFLGNNASILWERINRSLQTLNINKESRGLVEYVQQHCWISKKESIGFRKHSSYKDQNEYRYLIHCSCDKEYISINVGSLRDISTLYTIDEFENIANSVSLRVE